MKITDSRFLTSSPDLSHCPQNGHPEFAFIGRSNVGKSSLINSLLNRNKPLAEVSAKPGRTQFINHYQVNHSWHLVDLPGYGYSKVSGKQQDQFQESVSDYLLNSPQLACVFALIDSRHKPQRIDLQFTQWLLDHQVPFVLVFTKADKAKHQALQQHIDQFLDTLAADNDALPKTFISSAPKQLGRKQLLHFIQQILDATKEE